MSGRGKGGTGLGASSRTQELRNQRLARKLEKKQQREQKRREKEERRAAFEQRRAASAQRRQLRALRNEEKAARNAERRAVKAARVPRSRGADGSRFTKYKIPQAPKLLKVPKKASINRLSEIEATNKRRVAKFEDKLAANERKVRIAAERERQRKARQEEIQFRRLQRMMKQTETNTKRENLINSIEVKGQDNDKKIVQILEAQDYCAAVPYIKANCALKKKVEKLRARRRIITSS